MHPSRLRELEWEAIAGIVAAATGLVLHLLHVVEEDVLLAVALVLLALLLLRDLRREPREERQFEQVAGRLEAAIERLQSRLLPPETTLVGPRQLRRFSEQFAQRARGEMVWFNVCLTMFRTQELFDVLLRPAVENPHVSDIRFTLDRRDAELWDAYVVPKLAALPGREKVAPPLWTEIDDPVSFVLAEVGPGLTEAQLSFWGEPFMSRATGVDVPRYLFHVHARSDLVQRLADLERTYRLRGSAARG